MKLITTIAAIVLLSGCAALFPQKFDSNQYSMFVRVQVAAEQMAVACSGDYPEVLINNMLVLDSTTRQLTVFSKYLPDNSETYETATILQQDVVEMLERYGDPEQEQPSVAYCELKANGIADKAERWLEALGKTQ